MTVHGREIWKKVVDREFVSRWKNTKYGNQFSSVDEKL